MNDHVMDEITEIMDVEDEDTRQLSKVTSKIHERSKSQYNQCDALLEELKEYMDKADNIIASSKTRKVLTKSRSNSMSE